MEPLWKTVWWVLKKFKMKLKYSATIPVLIINPKEMNSTFHSGVWYSMIVKALSTVINE
jgi:hypothetical protein